MSKRVLHVGAIRKGDLPGHFVEYAETTLDLDPSGKADIVMDAREIARRMPSGGFGAVFCSHMLEHVPLHQVQQVLTGFLHVLEPDGYAYVIVPDLGALIKAAQGHELSDVYYTTAAGMPITFHDVLYGLGLAQERGHDLYAHRCGFTMLSLVREFYKTGFGSVLAASDGCNLVVAGFHSAITPDEQLKYREAFGWV